MDAADVDRRIAGYERTLPLDRRRALGAWSTPPELARAVTAATLAPLLADRPLRVLDPAAGAGAFLVAALRALLAHLRPKSAAATRAVTSSLAGWDVDPGAVAVANEALRATAILAGHDPGPLAIVRRRDALAARPRGFDAMLGNPPFVPAKLHARTAPDARRLVRERFATADGAFDLFVPFVELAVRALAENGRFGLVLPNRIAHARYATKLRALLATETELERVLDVGGDEAFRAVVFPLALVGARAAPTGAPVVVTDARGDRMLPRTAFSASGFRLESGLDVEARVATRRLGDVARVSAGTPGFSARATADALVEGGDGHPFIVSGNIDRYAVRLGATRFLGRDWHRPTLPRDARLSADRRQLYAGAKIVVAGIGRRIEAAFDPGGLALGVGTYAVVPHAIDPRMLLGLLGSSLVSHLHRVRGREKGLSSGYRALDKRDLEAIPVPVADDPAIVAAVDALLARHPPVATEPRPIDDETRALEAAIDERTFELYRVTPAERAAVGETMAAAATTLRRR